MTECPVCRGARFVRLPLYHPATFTEVDSGPLGSCEAYREIACPDCTDQVPFNRLGVLKEVKAIEQTGTLEEAQIRGIPTRQAVHAMVDRIMRDGLMAVEKVPTTRGYQLRCTLGVVAPHHVATFEERVAERQFEVANEVAEDAAREIEVWGSYYGQQTIHKSQALQSIAAALRKVRDRFNVKKCPDGAPAVSRAPAPPHTGG